MRKNWLLLGIAFLVAALAIGAVACGDDDDEDEAPTATEESLDDPVDDGDTDDDTDDDMDDDTATVIVTDGVLTDSAGNTLYIFDVDEAGVSNCTEGCVDIWPPLIIDGDATAGDGVGTLATITRDDGSAQVTHNDQPLYYFASDEAPGDRNGDGVGEIWHVVEAGG